MVTRVFLEGAHFQCTETHSENGNENIAFYQRLNQKAGPNAQCIDSKPDIFQEIQFAKQTNGQPTFEYQVLESNGFQGKMVNIKQFLLDG